MRVANKVVERHARAVGAGSAVVAAFAQARPVPSPAISVVLLALCGFTVAWAGASAPWWALIGASGIALLAAGGVAATIIAAVALATAAWIAVKRRDAAVARAVVAGLVVRSLLDADLGHRFGLSALVGVTTCATLAGVALGRRPREVRRLARRVVLGCTVAAVLAAVGFAAAAATAASQLRAGDQLAHKGLAALRRGEFSEAADLLDRAAQAFTGAQDDLDRPWAWPARAVPVLAQHADAASRLADAARVTSESVAFTVEDIDVESVVAADGAVDLDAVAALADPFARLDTSLSELRRVVEHVDTAWLLPAVGDTLHRLRVDLADNATALTTARQALAVAPAMLGADRPRTYLMLFTTASESRGLGGFPGNFAVLRADRGRLTMTRFGRWSDLEQEIDPTTLHIDEPTDFIDRYGQFGYELSADGRLKGSPWRNLTMPPDFPTVAQVAAQLYPQSGGEPVDGVVMADVEVLQALLTYTGPIKVDGWPVPITRKNAAQILLRDQYDITDLDQRVDFISSVAHVAIDRLISGALPDPVKLARTLGPLATQGRLAMWTPVPEEQALLAGAHLLGAFPDLTGTAGFGVAVTNLGGNKIDYYLQRSAQYETHIDGGRLYATLLLRFTNEAPTSGMPKYVIGNNRGLPQGTNQLRVCVQSPLTLDTATVSGDNDSSRPWERIPEFGVTSYCRSIIIPPGATTEVELGLVGDPPRTSGRPPVWVQPLVNPLELTMGGVTVQVEGGTR